PELKLWLTYATATESFGSFKVAGAQFVFEPNVRTHVPFTKDKGVGLDARLGFTLPAGGPLGSNAAFGEGNHTSIWGLRVTAGIPNYQDPINDGDPPALQFTAISTTFNNPIGIDYHEPSNTVVMSVNYPNGTPSVLERIQFDGSHQQFSNLTAFTDEVKIATV